MHPACGTGNNNYLMKHSSSHPLQSAEDHQMKGIDYERYYVDTNYHASKCCGMRPILPYPMSVQKATLPSILPLVEFAVIVKFIAYGYDASVY